MIKIQILPNGSVFFDQVEDSFYQILCSIREPVESGDPLVESRLFPQPSEDVEEEDLLDDFTERGVYASYIIGEIHADSLDEDDKPGLFRSGYAVSNGNTHGNKPLSLKLSKFLKP